MKAPNWYKVTIYAGPSCSITYKYSTPKEIRRDVASGNWMHFPTVKIRKISKLPPNIKERYIVEQRDAISSAQNMLNQLEKV